MRRAALAAVAALVVSLMVWVTTTPADAVLESGTALPPGPTGMVPQRLGFFGDEVWATWADADGVRHLYRTAEDGTGDWQPVDDPETGLPVTGGGFWDGVLYAFAPDSGQSGCSVLRVASAAGAWTTPSGACPSSVAVGPGGDLIRVRAGATATVYDATGLPVATGAAGQAAMFKTWLWSVNGGALVGHDTSGVAVDRQVALPSDCQSNPPEKTTGDASGNEWALALCAEGERVVPLTGDGAGLMMPFGSSISSMGNGFTYGPVVDGSTGGLEVRDLSAQLVSHDYGPGTGFVESDEGAPRIAWIENHQTVRVAHLDWLGTAPTAADDTSPPSIDSTDGSPAAIAVTGFDQDLTFSWTASDNLPGALAYDVEVGGLGGDPAFKPFQSTYGTTSVLKGVFGSGTVCFRVDAIDRVGNTSTWSTPRCTLLDHHAPQMQDGVSDRSGFPHIVNRVTRATVTDRFHATDDTGVVSYDVQQRVARPSRGLGPWTSPSAWQGITATSVTRTVEPGGEVCFRSRAHDAAGRTSPWGDHHCFVVPYDDYLLARHGHTSRRSVTGALDGKLTRLADVRASLTRDALAGRMILVREMVYRHAISCPTVTWAGRSLGQCEGGPEGRHFAWIGASSPKRQQGRVRIEGLVGLPLSIDAVAVVR